MGCLFYLCEKLRLKQRKLQDNNNSKVTLQQAKDQ